jgi:hypothetical protein
VDVLLFASPASAGPYLQDADVVQPGAREPVIVG